MRKMEQLRARVDELVGDPDVAERLKPWYAYFCKRPGFSDAYLQTFNRPNVTLVDTEGRGVERITPEGVVANGVTYELDCIILSTGFEQNDDYVHRNAFDFIGRDGLTLSKAWSDGPHTLHGLMAAGFPNLFFNGFLQNAQPVSVTYALDEHAVHIAYLVTATLEREAKAIEATPDAQRAWEAEVAKYGNRGRDYFIACTPGYYNSEGEFKDNPWSIVNLRYNGGPQRFYPMLQEIRDSGRLDGLSLTGAPADAPTP
jgi:cyclohexanone monooxygenase